LNNIQGSASPIESILGTCTYLRRQVRAEGGGGGTLLGGGEGGGAGNERGNDGRLEHGFVYCYCIGETGMRKELAPTRHCAPTAISLLSLSSS